jgi:hypothetical protein
MTFFTKKYLLFFVLCMAVTLCLISSPISAQTTRTELFRVSQNPAFAKPREVLRQLMASQQKTRLTRNTFCVIGYRNTSDAKTSNGTAWVYWKEQKAIILWEPSNLEIEPITQLARSRRYLKMPDDFVKTKSDIAGSTYLETWEWANDLIKTCRAKGDKYTIG